ncbi:PP2C family protein-serine/threonine phosphatase [Flectobacillus longus]|uniref:PP2C family protein-serine/threonine phosphatase n=1 Tax=Flectobacillus longus TaxID=2984207 RepID=UPI0024B6D19B|nr:protein phosphatase 2C domain-containing protein [Flectobacillus longus]MDI9878285.1 protein phosphatase 2C domain-containing protein [Flectobacillus longus]
MIQNIQFKTVSKSAIGGRRENQDSEGSLMTKLGFLCVVCDGMGGAAGGKTASTMAVNIILQEVANTTILHPALALLTAINKANHEIFSRGRQQTELRGMGTTVTALILNNDKATIAHAGDSRIYLLRDGEKVFRTNDHSKVFELVKRGILTEEQARLSEESNVIQRALGIAPDIEVEINDNIPFLKNDLFMLCTDGVCGAVPEENLLQMLTKEKDIRALAEKVITQIDTLGNRQGGGHDNLTVSFVQPLVNSKLEVKIDMKTKLIIYSLSTALALFVGLAGYLFFFGSSKTDTSKMEMELATLKKDTTQLNADLRQVKQECDSLKSKLNTKSSTAKTTTAESSSTNHLVSTPATIIIKAPSKPEGKKLDSQTQPTTGQQIDSQKSSPESDKDSSKKDESEKKNN